MTFCHAQGTEAGNECSPLFWHLQNSVPERAFSGTEYACRAQKGFLRYATRFQKLSVLKTGFWGTEGIFGTGNPLLWYGQAMCTGKDLLMYRMKRRKAASALRSVILRKNGHLYAPVTAAKQSQSAMDYLELPLNSCRQLWAATKPLQTTANHCKPPQNRNQAAANSCRLSWTAANCR